MPLFSLGLRDTSKARPYFIPNTLRSNLRRHFGERTTTMPMSLPPSLRICPFRLLHSMLHLPYLTHI